MNGLIEYEYGAFKRKELLKLSVAGYTRLSAGYIPTTSVFQIVAGG
jgi:hypothetical protein